MITWVERNQPTLTQGLRPFAERGTAPLPVTEWCSKQILIPGEQDSTFPSFFFFFSGQKLWTKLQCVVSFCLEHGYMKPEIFSSFIWSAVQPRWTHKGKPHVFVFLLVYMLVWEGLSLKDQETFIYFSCGNPQVITKHYKSLQSIAKYSVRT